MSANPLLARFCLPFPPSVNHYYRHGKHGSYMSDTARRYRAEAQVIMLQQGAHHIDGPVHVSLVFVAPDDRRRDIDNLRKGVYDAISDRYDRKGHLVHKGLLWDDSQIHSDYAALYTKSEAPSQYARCGMVEVSIYHNEEEAHGQEADTKTAGSKTRGGVPCSPRRTTRVSAVGQEGGSRTQTQSTSQSRKSPRTHTRRSARHYARA